MQDAGAWQLLPQEQPAGEDETAGRDEKPHEARPDPAGDRRADQAANQGARPERPDGMPHDGSEKGEQHGREQIGRKEDDVLE